MLPLSQHSIQHSLRQTTERLPNPTPKQKELIEDCHKIINKDPNVTFVYKERLECPTFLIETLMKVLESSPLVTSLHFIDSDIEDGIETIASKLSPYIKSIEIESTHFKEMGAQALAASLATSTTLTGLSITESDITMSGITALASALTTNNFIQDFSFTANDEATEANIKELVDALSKNKTLHTISLCNNENTTENSTQNLANVLTNKNLTKITLIGCNITNDRVVELASALETNTSLRELALQKTNITDIGAQALANALETNTTLIKLSFIPTMLPILLQQMFPNKPYLITDQYEKALQNALKNNLILFENELREFIDTYYCLRLVQKQNTLLHLPIDIIRKILFFIFTENQQEIINNLTKPQNSTSTAFFLKIDLLKTLFFREKGYDKGVPHWFKQLSINRLK